METFYRKCILRKNSIYPLAFLILLNLSPILSYSLFFPGVMALKPKFISIRPHQVINLLLNHSHSLLYFHVHSEFPWFTHLFLWYHCGFIPPLPSHISCCPFLKLPGFIRISFFPCPQKYLSLRLKNLPESHCSHAHYCKKFFPNIMKLSSGWKGVTA